MFHAIRFPDSILHPHRANRDGKRVTHLDLNDSSTNSMQGDMIFVYIEAYATV